VTSSHRLLKNDAISGLSPVGDTGNEGVAATSSPRGALPVPPSLFSKSKETGSHPQIHFWFVDPMPEMDSLLLLP
jgi:hypothetical protein